MMPKNLTTAELERVYDLMAEGIDRAGADQAPLFLAKLAFALANLYLLRRQLIAPQGTCL